MNKYSKLSLPEREVNFKEESLSLYDQKGMFEIRRSFDPYILQNPMDWQANPFKDVTWQLYYHSFYWIGVLCYGVEKYIHDDQKRADQYRYFMVDILTSYVDFILENESHPDMVWDDHSVSYRTSYFSYCYEAHIADLLNNEQKTKFIKFIKIHTDKIIEFINSGKWQLSNHTIFQVEGLGDASFVFFNDDKYGKNNLVLARNTLQSYIEKTISVNDGTSKEHALFYHAFAMARIRKCSDYLSKLGYPIDINLTALFKKMNTFLWTVMPYNLHIPSVGDTKYGMLIPTKYLEPFYSSEFVSEAVQYLQTNGKVGVKPPSLLAFREDGYYIFREKNEKKNKEVFLLFLEKLYIGPHGHVDGNSFVAYFDKEPFLIDSGGPYKYADSLRYKYFQTQLAHNTLIFDHPERYFSSIGQVFNGDNFDLVIGKVLFDSGHQWVRIFGRAYHNIAFIVDIAIPNKPKTTITARFHLAPHLKFTQISENRYSFFGENNMASVEFVSGEKIPLKNIFNVNKATNKIDQNITSQNLHGFESFHTKFDGKYERSTMICRAIEALTPHLSCFCFDSNTSPVSITQEGNKINISIINEEAEYKENIQIPIVVDTDSKGNLNCFVENGDKQNKDNEDFIVETEKKMNVDVNCAKSFKSNGFNDVNGWLNEKVLDAIDCCVDMMKTQGHQWENTLEIGVHEGKFFIPLEIVSPDNVKAFALDVFDMQMFNIDHSGLGNLERFEANVKKYSRIPERVNIFKEDSFNILSTVLKDKKYSLISIDGGHTVQHIMFDMEFAANTLQAGGIIIVDDFPNNSWTGVLEGVTLFFHQNRHRIAPFAVGYNKLFISTVSYQKIYFNYIRENAEKNSLDLGRITQFCNWSIQVLAKRHFRPL